MINSRARTVLCQKYFYHVLTFFTTKMIFLVIFWIPFGWQNSSYESPKPMGIIYFLVSYTCVKKYIIEETKLKIIRKTLHKLMWKGMYTSFKKYCVWLRICFLRKGIIIILTQVLWKNSKNKGRIGCYISEDDKACTLLS